MKPKRFLMSIAVTTLVVPAFVACASQDTNSGSPKAAGNAKQEHFGGTMTMAYAEDPETFDPAKCTGATCWGNMRLLYDRLYDYKGATTDLVAQAAAGMPEVSSDGKTYTLKLKPDVKFSTGKAITAKDVAYSYARILDPETKAGLAEFWTGIEGAQSYAKNPKGLPKGIKVIDDKTLTVTLSAPSSTFKYIMAMPAGSIIPEGSGSTIAKAPVGSGPFVLQNYSPGKSLTLTRNKGYWDSPRPYIDKVIENLGVSPDNQALMLQKGDIDLMGDPIPASKFLEITNNPALKSQIFKMDKASIYYLTLNVKTAPFDNPKVREAVSYAMDRGGLIKLVNGQAKPANEFIPPGVLGHTDEKLTHDQDLGKAKKLMAEAGFAGGTSTKMYAWNIPPFNVLAPEIQQNLKAIGINTELQTLAPNTFQELASSGKAPVALTFWIADYPDGSDFLQALMSCATVKGGQNFAGYCNKDMDAFVQKALAAKTSEDAAKNYVSGTKLMMSDNPIVPLYYGTVTKFVGKNVGNYHDQPIWGGDMAQYWKLNDGSAQKPANW